MKLTAKHRILCTPASRKQYRDIRDVFNTNGHYPEWLHTYDVKEARQIIRNEEFDCAIIAQRLKNGDGIDVLAQLYFVKGRIPTVYINDQKQGLKQALFQKVPLVFTPQSPEFLGLMINQLGGQKTLIIERLPTLPHATTLSAKSRSILPDFRRKLHSYLKTHDCEDIHFMYEDMAEKMVNAIQTKSSTHQVMSALSMKADDVAARILNETVLSYPKNVGIVCNTSWTQQLIIYFQQLGYKNTKYPHKACLGDFYELDAISKSITVM